MYIKNMFAKDIDRDIKGVIKVGQKDDENIKQELEEYVVTKELQKHFADFLRAIPNPSQDKQTRWAYGYRASSEVVSPTF